MQSAIKKTGIVVGFITILVPLLTYRKTSRRSRGRKSSSEGSPITWTQMLAATILYLGGGIALWRPIPLLLSKGKRLFTMLVGCGLYFPGVSLYLWGHRYLGEQFSPSNTSGASLFQDHRLITRGPYRWVRHPMYLGVLLAAGGALLIFQTWAMVIYALSSLVVILRARKEEELLVEEFGEEWKRYQGQVPGWLPRPDQFIAALKDLGNQRPVRQGNTQPQEDR